MTRALRRHHTRRIKKAREMYWYAPYVGELLTGADLGKCAATPKICSCWQCANPRAYGEDKSFAERRQEGTGV